MTSAVLYVTTALKPDAAVIARAGIIAAELNAPYISRDKRTLALVFRETKAQRLLVIRPVGVELRDLTGALYAYHPNLTLVRGTNILSGHRDLFAEATALKPGDHLLDCTLGFASEAMLGAILVGDTGRVIGLESAPALASVTRDGLSNYLMPGKTLRAAMRRVEVRQADYRDYLANCAAKSFDVVYFDPFFEERLSGAEHSISPLACFGDLAPLAPEAVIEAGHVARQRVVIKHPKQEPLPAEVAALITKNITSRRSRVVYAVIE